MTVKSSSWNKFALAAVLGGEDAALSKFFKKLLWILSPLIGWIFAHMSFLIPVTRLRETPNLLAFHHPSPGYKFHVLIIPKRQVASLAQLDPADTAFLTDLYSTVQSLVEEFHLQAYRLIVNGGEYQDFPHLHFHLISDVTGQKSKV